MRKTTFLALFLGLLAVFTYKNSFAQAVEGDSSSQKYAFNNAISLFHASLGLQSPLYNGPEYYSYDPLIKGNAYFSDVNAFTPGSVFYDGALYSNAPMIYDLYSDNLVLLLYNHFSKFALIKEKVKSFDFLDHHFVGLKADTIKDDKSGIKSGYYDELYKGKLQVLAKRSKSIQTSTGGTLGNEKYFTPSTDYYLRKNNVYYSINGQGSMLSVLKDRKKELEQFIKKSQIKFRKEPEEAMVQIATYYDRLTN